MSGYIGVKHQKILWGRAAAKCSFPDCRKSLSVESEDEPETVGAMAHIVGESLEGPRGDSDLPLEERNSYSNLILLCSHHHDLIDTQKSLYSIEYLHQIKTDHEEWVRESLAGSADNPDELVAADVIDTIVMALRLERWAVFCDNAVRDLLPGDIFEIRGLLNNKLLSMTWSSSVYPNAGRAARAVIDSFSEYVSNFELHCEERANGKMLGPDKSYQRLQLRFDTRRVWAEWEEYWSTRNWLLFYDFTAKLNEFCEAVRDEVNPMFFKLHGHFVISDSLGFRHDGRSTLVLPDTKKVQPLLLKFPERHPPA